MNNIKVEEVKGSFKDLIIDNVHQSKKYLDSDFLNSDSNLLTNLIQETEALIREAANGLRTYHERHLIFVKINRIWMDAWRRYSHLTEAIALGEVVDQITNYSMAYSYLYLSLSRINEDRTEDDNENLQRITSGFLLLSEIIDVFVDLFTDEELQGIYNSANNVLSMSTRTSWIYFEDDPSASNLTTQLRAYSSLIVLRIDERQNLERPGSGASSKKSERNSSEESTFVPAWEKIDGIFANIPSYDEAVQLGQEYRKSHVPTSPVGHSDN